MLIFLVSPVEAVLEGSGSGLVGWWKFNEGTGTTASDSSGSGYNGTFTGAPTWATTAPTGSPYPVAGGLYFDGVKDYITVHPLNSARPIKPNRRSSIVLGLDIRMPSERA